MKTIDKGLTNRQKEVVKLLQNKEVLITGEKDVLITSNNGIKKVTPHTFYNLVNKGLLVHQTEWPYSYELSAIGKSIKVGSRAPKKYKTKGSLKPKSPVSYLKLTEVFQQ